MGEDEGMARPRPAPHGTPAVRPPLVRPSGSRVLAGVSAGLALHLGVPVLGVRLVFLVLIMLGGAGALAYTFLWVFVPQGEASPATGPVGPVGRSAQATGVLLLGLALLVAGLALSSGLQVNTSFWVPVVVIAAGAVFAWAQLDETTRRRWMPDDPRRRGVVLVWVGIGLAVAVVGLVLLTTRQRALTELWAVIVPVLVVLVGVGVIVAPFATRLWADLRTEQTERIRATERADIAAHLHDSVLQTLALIQRSSGDPQVTRLARAQERELRQWLYAGPPGPEATLARAVAEVAAEVEDLYGVPIDVVLTGDHVATERTDALVAALREALVNAVQHGAPPVSAYVEVGQGQVEAFVRDHGPGFELDEVPPDRLGVRESVVGRMNRHGGLARVRALEDGTEISLSLPLYEPAGVEESSDGR
ncbi:MAG TPA: PspC domain-containing protein [Ornithinimicrobium sp.]|uniref:ATP-binding protein n=1 Tax=Ornithinimicrobium sp. TaxID=1977084 RepID=UPI002B490D30|nr:PspC domain-containing protein [Ornithinimicrobium sp.]HKJ11151.1 PspC domain-containing protein [Ornithinimicrobium sp.]